jgi:hypothetical protein
MQRCLILILVTIVFAFSALSCSAITFDGEPNNSEWADSEVYALEKPEGFNNSIKSAYVQLKSDTDKNQLYLCVTMNVKEVERVEDLIKKAELEVAKSEGQIQTLRTQWKKLYGTDNEQEIKEILKKQKAELTKTQERLNVLYNKLLEACDWDSLEEELS